MQATNGSASRGALLGCSVALALLLTTLILTPAAQAAKAAPPTETYLALGDSLAFGYSQQKFDENAPNEAPAYFENGYVDTFAKLLKKTHKGLVTVNDGCPGETSDGLIGQDEAIGGQNEPAYTPCPYHFERGFPLHNSLESLSQLEDAVSILSSENPDTKTAPAHPVVAITLSVGATDELTAVEACEREVNEEFTEAGKSKYGPNPEEALTGCLVAHAFGPSGVLAHIQNNLKDITNVIDSTGYSNPIVLLGFYNPETFVLPGSDGLQEIMNAKVEEEIAKGEFPANVSYANPFRKFNPGPQDSAREKARIAKLTEMCNPSVQKPTTGHDPGCEGDIDPSLAGYRVLGRLAFGAF